MQDDTKSWVSKRLSSVPRTRTCSVVLVLAENQKALPGQRIGYLTMTSRAGLLDADSEGAG